MSLLKPNLFLRLSYLTLVLYTWGQSEGHNPRGSDPNELQLLTASCGAGVLKDLRASPPLSAPSPSCEPLRLPHSQALGWGRRTWQSRSHLTSGASRHRCAKWRHQRGQGGAGAPRSAGRSVPLGRASPARGQRRLPPAPLPSAGPGAGRPPECAEPAGPDLLRRGGVCGRPQARNGGMGPAPAPPPLPGGAAVTPDRPPILTHPENKGKGRG